MYVHCQTGLKLEFEGFPRMYCLLLNLNQPENSVLNISDPPSYKDLGLMRKHFCHHDQIL